MAEPGESKRDQAVEVLCEILMTVSCPSVDRSATFVALIVDAAKEEIRAELAEQAEERHWRIMKAIVDGPADGPLGEEFWAEYWALKAKREAAGKMVD